MTDEDCFEQNCKKKVAREARQLTAEEVADLLAD